MCRFDELGLDLPPWLPWLLRAAGPAWKYREVGGWALGVVAALAGFTVLAYHLGCPSDLERARADIERARQALKDHEATGFRLLEEMNEHAGRREELDKLIENRRHIPDKFWLEARVGERDGQRKLYEAKDLRRDNVLRQATEFRRLVVEARCELLRAEDARDAGAPYPVAPRIRAILAPVRTAR